MENYEVLTTAGEGSYGIVMKCRHKSSKKIVAIKKLMDHDNDDYIKKIILREIRILKKLKHENLVQLLEVIKKKRRFYLVFEYLEKTVLDDLENNPNGLNEKQAANYIFQLIRAIDFCHSQHVIHRDIKPENLLVSMNGILKLCDFGCARMLNGSNANYTEYIATRWYRAPELLVRDKKYGKPVDIWAIGCVFAEMLTGQPLFPGQSDVDQLYLITKRLGKLCPRHQQLLNNQISDEIDDESISEWESSMNNFHALHNMFPSWSLSNLNMIALCLHLDPNKRPTAPQLLHDDYYNRNLSASHKSKEIKHKSIIFNEFGVKCDLEVNSNHSTPRSFSELKVLNEGEWKRSPKEITSPTTSRWLTHNSSDLQTKINIFPSKNNQVYSNAFGTYASMRISPKPLINHQLWSPFVVNPKCRNLNYENLRNKTNNDEHNIVKITKSEEFLSKNKTFRNSRNEFGFPSINEPVSFVSRYIANCKKLKIVTKPMENK